MPIVVRPVLYRSMGMTREGRASSTRSKKSRSILAALREKTEKFAPPFISVAPNGSLRPVDGTATRFSITACSSHLITAFAGFCLVQELESIPGAASNSRQCVQARGTEAT